MDTFIQTHEAAIRLGAFVGIFALMALWELAGPRRPAVARSGRWPNNLGLLLVDVAVVRVVAPGATPARVAATGRPALRSQLGSEARNTERAMLEAAIDAPLRPAL